MNITHLTPDEHGDIDWPTLDRNRRSVLGVGVFDGFHRGHRAVVERIVELARRHDAFSVVVLFDPRPGFVHGYAKAHDGAEPPVSLPDPQLLASLDERLRLMAECGVEHVFVVRYTLPFAEKSYRYFLGQMVGKLGMRTLVLGSDAAMGRGCEGDVKAIGNLAAATGVFELDVVDDRGPGEARVPRDMASAVHAPSAWGEPADPLEGMTKAERRAWSKRHNARAVRFWSSTNVRWQLAQGRVAAAAEILGRPHAVEGTVVHGEQRGRTIGFPTANLGDDPVGCLPADGVYAGWLTDLGTGEDRNAEPAEPRRWPAAISIGTKPTFNEATGLKDRVVEAYAITGSNEWIDLYDHRVRVEFLRFLRPQVKFDGVEALTDELRRNVEETLRVVE